MGPRSGAFGTAVAVVVLASLARAQATPTNYDLVRAAAHLAGVELVTGLKTVHTSSEPLALRAVGTHAGNFLVENALSAALTEAGIAVRTEAESIDRILEFEVVDLGLTYPHSRRRAWLGERRVTREARARLFARLVDPAAASVVWADAAEAKQTDEVPVSKLVDLEEKSPADYMKATLPARRWNKVVEPVVVTGIVVGLIVLFFSNQETN
jgi:hypothetical protein